MNQLVAVMGLGPVPSDTALITADDLGFTRGDGCFDAARVVVDADGIARVDHLDSHLARLGRSSAALELPDLNESAWRQLITQALGSWKEPGEGVLKLIRSRGLEHSPSAVTEILTITPAPDASQARLGVRAVTLNRGYAANAFADPWLLGGVKTLSYAVNVAAKREVARRGADEAIFVSTDGYLLEAPTAGLLIAAADQLWTTPVKNTGVLTSVTVEVIMAEAAAQGVGTQEALFRPEELATADGLWIASAVRGVLPVLELDGVALPHNPELTAHLARTAGF